MEIVSSPRFSISVNQDRLLLTHETQAWLFESPIYFDIARELTQGTTHDKLETELSPHYGRDAVRSAARELAEIGFLRRRPADAWPMETLAWWEGMGGEPERKSVSLAALAPNGSDLLRQCLASANIHLAGDAPLLLVVTDDYLRPGTGEAIARHESCLLVKLVGHIIWLGPHFRRGETVCYECLAWWLRMHRWEQYTVAGEQGLAAPLQPSSAHTPATLALAAGLVSTAAVSILTRGRHPGLNDNVILFDTRTLERTEHALRASPRCATCRPGLLAPLRRYVSTVGGMIRQLHIPAEPSCGLRHATAEYVYPLPDGIRRHVLKAGGSFGSAITGESAEQACLAEAIERYSAAFRGDEETAAQPAPGEAAIRPGEILLHSEAQYAAREPFNAKVGGLFYVPERLADGQAIRWVQATALAGGERVWIPAGLVYFAWPFEREPVYAVPDSNGCAAGRTLEDALFGALLELIERDALSIWWYNRVARPEVPVEGIADATVSAVVAGLRDEGRRPYLLDVTTDVGIPAYVALAPRADGSEPLFASAASVCPHKAAAKAFRELAQIHFWNGKAGVPPLAQEWLTNAHTEANAFSWLRPAGEAKVVTPVAMSASGELAHCQTQLEQAGIASYWVDLTRREVGLPVVRVIAPGLRHPWARFAPGRLYDVPVEMGWRDRRLVEGELNPALCYL